MTTYAPGDRVRLHGGRNGHIVTATATETRRFNTYGRGPAVLRDVAVVILACTAPHTVDAEGRYAPKPAADTAKTCTACTRAQNRQGTPGSAR